MDPKRKSIIKYFTNTFPKWAVVLIAIGLIMILSGVSHSIGVAGFGLLLGVAGAAGIWSYTQVPTDQQIDEWTREDLSPLTQQALKKSGMDKSELVGETVTIIGPAVGEGMPGYKYVKRGKDGLLRFARYQAAALNFTQNQLLTYKCVVDITTGNTSQEGTDEYFYKDVVSVSTKTAGYSNNNKDYSDGESFELTTSGGTSIRVFLKSNKLAQDLGGEMPANDAERGIQAIRKMLREKKSA